MRAIRIKIKKESVSIKYPQSLNKTYPEMIDIITNHLQTLKKQLERAHD